MNIKLMNRFKVLRTVPGIMKMIHIGDILKAVAFTGLIGWGLKRKEGVMSKP